MIVDVHSHLVHPETVRRFPVPSSLGDVDRLLEIKGAAGIDLTVVGSPNGAGTMVPARQGGRTYQQPLDQLLSFHEWLGEIVADHRDRLRAYVYCDPFADQNVLEAVVGLLAHEEFVGLLTNPSGRGEYLDSPKADQFFSMAAEVDVPVMVHSGAEPACCGGIGDYGLVEMVGRYCDVTLGLAALVLSGRLEAHPTLAIIGTANGGALSVLGSRLDLAWRPRHWEDAGSRAPEGNGSSPLHRQRTESPPSELMKRLYVDTTGDSAHAHLANIEVFGAASVLFGTDWPPLPIDHRDKIDAIEQLPISEEDRRAIMAGNAQGLFKLDQRATAEVPA